ncbi:MAG: tetratricopeptide repeat protein [Proteobacteria bacterium]|nr:tetratricopeptide repeat protein [Pseudomonadota bacterium]MCP4919156.1 tetratricopeptide repeat protein [Pseudomonadota bacterium]
MTRLLRIGGRLLGRPDEEQLHDLTGRQKGGPVGTGSTVYAQALTAGRRAIETGENGEALYQFGLAADARPAEAWPWHGRGDALQLSGDHAGALAAYDEAVERVPGLALAHNGRGNALDGLGRREEAVAAWEKALELDPRLSWPRRSLERGGALG